MSIKFVKIILGGIWQNRSILRSSLYYELPNTPNLSGSILDLGAKNKGAAYYRFLNIEKTSRVTTCDLSQGADVQVDLEGKMPFENEQFDNALCFNLLEHIYNYKSFLSETRRIVKRGGYLIGFTPFFMKIHGDPGDYFRYSGSALKKVLEESGFDNITIRPISYGPMSSAYSQIEFLLPRIMRTLIVFIPVSLDMILRKIRPDIIGDRYPFGYIFVCK